MVTLKEGDKAPVFKGIDQNGNKISLADYKGKKVVLFFYPEDDTPTCTIQACNLRDNYALLKQHGFEVIGVSPDDDTPTCTIQACNLRDNYALLKQHGFEVIGVSPDDAKSHKKFEKKFNLPFTLIADPKHSILEKYGVWDQKQMFGHKYMGVLRTTFVIDEKGVIRKIFLRPKNKAHAEEIIKAWNGK